MLELTGHNDRTPLHLRCQEALVYGEETIPPLVFDEESLNIWAGINGQCPIPSDKYRVHVSCGGDNRSIRPITERDIPKRFKRKRWDEDEMLENPIDVAFKEWQTKPELRVVPR